MNQGSFYSKENNRGHAIQELIKIDYLLLHCTSNIHTWYLMSLIKYVNVSLRFHERKMKDNQDSNISTPSTKFFWSIINLNTYVKISANTMERDCNGGWTFDFRGKSKFLRNLWFSWFPWNWSGREKKRFSVQQLLKCNVR